MNDLDPMIDESRPASAADIEALEGALSLRLPDSYRQFLGAWGRSTFAGEAFVAASSGERLVLSLLFGGGDGEGGVLRELRRHPDLAAEQIVPIGMDFAYNLYVLDGKRGFSVHFLEWRSGGAAAQSVAASFQDFLQRIRVVLDDEPPAPG